MACFVRARHVFSTECGGELVTLKAKKEDPPSGAVCKDLIVIKSATVIPAKKIPVFTDIVSSSSLPPLAIWLSLTDI